MPTKTKTKAKPKRKLVPTRKPPVIPPPAPAPAPEPPPPVTPPAAPAPPMTRMLMLVDETGSMSGRQAETVQGINLFLREQRAVDVPCAFTLVLFSRRDDGAPVYRPRISDRPIKRVADLTAHEYNPAGFTPLLDAVGRAIKHLADSPPADRTLLVVVTDGLENCSAEYRLEGVRALIQAKEAEGWVFVFLGANPAAWAGGLTMGMPQANTVPYDPRETVAAYAKVSVGTRDYRVKGLTGRGFWTGGRPSA